ncbi:GNAT family N-acetyltransferase [Deinococcus arcticus]|uniref:GNAT family N-acetyltransferase n=1 Tax=Deinococcus arcticus TaxID=2136176 RepID=A0A2T3W842_9DEIO|nr:GNAT family N-acetyltransferase [Deinococcus arcticus]PTA68059.1 GNAT family N-acetyltransferase [Deinococcus arcticus]
MRPAVPADAPVIAAHRYPDEADAGERAPYAAWVAGALARGLYLGFVREEAGVVVAGAGLTLLEWGPSRHDPQPWRARLVNVWTHPDRRRQGHARALVQACLNAAQARGITRLSLGTTDMARGLYQALGFTHSGRELTLVLGGPPPGE